MTSCQYPLDPSTKIMGPRNPGSAAVKPTELVLFKRVNTSSFLIHEEKSWLASFRALEFPLNPKVVLMLQLFSLNGTGVRHEAWESLMPHTRYCTACGNSTHWILDRMQHIYPYLIRLGCLWNLKTWNPIRFLRWMIVQSIGHWESQPVPLVLNIRAYRT